VAQDGGATRHQSRERALSLLYEAEMKGVTPAEVVAALPVPPDPYCAHLIEAVGAHRVRADELVAAATIGWPPERMAVVDRLVLRLATAELLDEAGPPEAVVLELPTASPGARVLARLLDVLVTLVVLYGLLFVFIISAAGLGGLGATAVIIFNIIADLVYGLLDPRIRYA